MSVNYSKLLAPTIDGAPQIVRLPKKLKPEDITLDDLRHLSNESFALWTQTANVQVDGNHIDFNMHRYLLPIYLCNDDEIVWQKAAQLGATVYMLLRVVHWLHTHQGRKAGLYFPTKEGVDNLSKDRLTPLLDSISELNGKIDKEDKLGLRKIGKSSFYLFHLGGIASKDSVPLDFVAFDEVRLCKPAEIDQALERISHSPYKQKIFMSTCHSKDTRILVRKKQTEKHWKVSNPIESKSFRELENCWEQYQALCQYQSQGLNYTFRDITAFHNNGVKEVVRATFDDGTHVVATPDHEYAWCDSFGKTKTNVVRWEQLSKLRESYSDPRREYDKNSILTLRNLSQYEEVAAPFDLLTYYVFGAYGAEGCTVAGTTNTISIAQLPTTDTPIRARVVEWANRNGFHVSEQKTCVRVSLKTRPDLYKLFASFGTHCHNKRIPEVIRNGSTSQIRELLAGYIDGDGTRRTDHSWDITTTSLDMLHDLKLMSLRIGEPAYIREYEGRTQNSVRSYQLCYNANSDRILSRPLNSLYRAARLVDLQDCGTKEVCDITVDQYHNFVLENGMVAHNCGLPSADIAARFELGTQHIWMAKCFIGETRIWVREKSTGKVFTKRIDALENYEQYQALSVDTQHKKQVWRDIIGFHKNGVQKVNTLTYGNGTTVTCTPDHLFAWVSRKTLDTVSYVQAKDILSPYRKGKYQRNNLLTTSGIFAESSTAEEQAPYDNLTLAVVGAFVAEGSWKTDNSINIAQLEGKHLHELVQVWAEANNLPHNPTSKGVDVSLVSRPDLRALFAECGKGCENKRIPERLLSTSARQAKYILDGYLSGDGCRHEIAFEERHKPRGLNLLLDTAWEAVTASEKLATQLQELSLRAGYYTSIRKNPILASKKQTWSVSYHPNSTRVHNRLNKELHTTSIVSCVDAGEAEVYDITVDAIEDRNHNFVLANGSVVHNCGCEDGCDLARTFPDCVVDDKKRGKLYLRCPKCKYVIHDTQNGRYVAHNPGASYTSFHVSQLASKYMPLKTLWDFYHRTTNKAEFFNAKLGLPYIDEENRGVSLSSLRACVDPMLEWAAPGRTSQTAMGVDVGGGYCYVVIADLTDSKKRIRHVEIIEADNPNYMEAGKRVSPFKRLRELMREYKVQLCVVDAMPNYDMVIEFAQEFPGKVFASFYAKEAKDVVSWSDKPKVKAGLKKAGPLLKFKYYCVLSRYLSMDVALAQWQNQEVICPDPDRLVQMCFKENTKDLMPEAPMNRAFSMFMRLIKKFSVSNEETGEGRHEWIYSGSDPHFAHAWNYCNIALERLKRGTVFSFV